MIHGRRFGEVAGARDDIYASGLFGDVELVTTRRRVALPAQRYLRLVQTFGPFRAKSPAEQRRTLDALAAARDSLGGGTVLDLRGSLALARRPA